MNHREPEENLSEKLRAWEVNPPVSSSFQREVWKRIADRKSAREESAWPDTLTDLCAHKHWLEQPIQDRLCGE